MSNEKEQHGCPHRMKGKSCFIPQNLHKSTCNSFRYLLAKRDHS